MAAFHEEKPRRRQSTYYSSAAGRSLRLSCLPFTQAAPPSSESSQVHSIIAEIQPQAQEAITTYLAPQQSRVIAVLEGARYFPAEFKRPLAVHTLNDPWAGLETLEQRAMQAANTTGATAEEATHFLR